jgi:anhydro-N-acetylmuramic acid kinase
MSGTSLDGVDAAVIETDGERIAAFGPVEYRPYRESERALLRQALAEAVTLTDRTARPGILAEAEELTTRVHAETVEELMLRRSLKPADFAVVGFHGQTVIHKPAERLTVQIGDGTALAKRLHIPVAYDFRQADVMAGGQGAPLCRCFTARSCKR